MRVLITGAAGRLGRMLLDALSERPDMEVAGLDIRPDPDPRIHEADLSGPPDWAAHLEGVDTVVHLSGDSGPGADWPSAVRHNMDATLELYHQAAERGVGRVVLASSSWVLGDKRFTGDALGEDAPPGPVNAYGMSKLFCERTGAHFARHRDLSVICLRIGYTLWTPGERPGPQMAMGRWGQEMWLSDRDFLSGAEAAIRAEGVGFAVLNLMSDNPGMRWDLGPARRVIGYAPRDGAAARVGPAARARSLAARLLTRTLPRAFASRFPDW